MRKIGSGNIGATNVLRTGNKGLAAATLLLDLLKGTVAVLLVDEVARRYVAFEAFQLVLPGRPRRLPRPHLPGVAAASRAARASPPTSACCSACIGRRRSCSAWCGSAVAAGTRYSSLAALAATVAVVLYYLRHRLGRACLFILIMSLLIFVKHHANIRRLLAGEESKIGARQSSSRSRGLSARG